MLAHGTFSNHRSCRGLARHLSRCGFNCWLLDFQGHGISETPRIEPDFESMCLADTAAAIDYVAADSTDGKTWWIGHSGGGLAILMYLARDPHRQSRLHGLITLASQATEAAAPLSNRVAIRMASLVTSVLRVAPGRLLKLGPENEFAAVMQQWYRWSLSGRWEGSDGFNYLEALKGVTVPSFSLAAAADNFIAPPAGCEKIHRCLGAVDKTYRLCGLHAGDREDYSHARIVSSRNASVDIWPRIAEWLHSRA
ncbi:hypothetical protein AB833_06390 [Chromatiales bacterium (ex Bugula neritina AB1)]|nr:hypothetical protein AB833_06390 [Chromatiales bacterium (ex Bugula neritina AB1)]